jgi:hypothetical protein
MRLSKQMEKYNCRCEHVNDDTIGEKKKERKNKDISQG